MDDRADQQIQEAVAPGALAAVAPPEIQHTGRTAVFTALVKGDSDITGLVAYSIFKQNELDWLASFRASKNREPTEAESDAYIIGESTPRRLSTYRHLADATLAGRGPDVVDGSSPSRALVSRNEATAVAGLGGSTIVYILLAIVVLLAVYFAARYGVAK